MCACDWRDTEEESKGTGVSHLSVCQLYGCLLLGEDGLKRRFECFTTDLVIPSSIKFRYLIVSFYRKSVKIDAQKPQFLKVLLHSTLYLLVTLCSHDVMCFYGLYYSGVAQGINVTVMLRVSRFQGKV